MGAMPPVTDGAHATRRDDVVEVGGGAVGATSGVVGATLGTGGTTLRTGAVGGGSVRIGSTIRRGAGVGVGDVDGIVR
jgi:phage-related minor tail protein